MSHGRWLIFVLVAGCAPVPAVDDGQAPGGVGIEEPVPGDFAAAPEPALLSMKMARLFAAARAIYWIASPTLVGPNPCRICWVRASTSFPASRSRNQCGS